MGEIELVRVLAGNMPPYITTSDGSSGVLGGFLGEIWSILEIALKFESNITSLQFDEAERQLENGRGDIMLYASVAFKSKRLEFSQPLLLNWYRLYMKKPKARASPGTFLKIFDANLWMSSIISLILLIFFLWINAKTTKRFNRQQPVLSIPVCYFAITGGFLNQGYDPKIKSTSGRIILFTALVFGFVLFSAMNALLVAHLAVFTTELPFKNLQEIADIKTHSLCIRKSNYVYKNFTDVNRTLLPKWRGIINGKHCRDIEDQENISKIICDENVVILENRVIVYSVRKRHNIPCDITYMNTKLFPRGNVIIFYKHFRFKKRISKFLTTLKNYGIIQRIEKIWIGSKFVNIPQQIASPVTLNHISGILTLFATMVMLSLIILGVEIIIHQHTNTKFVGNKSKNNYLF